jgi:hypothetical protein
MSHTTLQTLHFTTYALHPLQPGGTLYTGTPHSTQRIQTCTPDATLRNSHSIFHTASHSTPHYKAPSNIYTLHFGDHSLDRRQSTLHTANFLCLVLQPPTLSRHATPCATHAAIQTWPSKIHIDTLDCKFYTPRCKLHTSHYALSTPHFTFNSLQMPTPPSTLHTLQFTPKTFYLHAQRCVSHSTHPALQLHTIHGKLRTPHPANSTRQLPHSTHSPHCTNFVHSN